MKVRQLHRFATTAERLGARRWSWILSIVVLAAVLVGGCEIRAEGRRLFPPAQEADQAGTPTPGAPQATAAAPISNQQGGAVALAGGLNAVQVVQEARPSVVNITVGVVPPEQFRRPVPVQAGTGTGVIFDARGYILTNSHVINPEGTRANVIRVTLFDDRTFEAQVVDDDPLNDLAIIKIEASNLRPARIGDSDKLQVGEPVVAIGHALALPGGPTVTTGVVSAVGRQIDEPNGITLPNLIQTDAAINPGNSGGPLLNARAEVIGINTAGIRGEQIQGINFAVAINQAKPAIDSVIATGRVVRPCLGVGIAAVITPPIARINRLPAERGVLVQVEPGGPAARAGLRDGDIIVQADSREIRSAPDLLNAIRQHKPGEQLRVRAVRSDGQTVDVTVTLAERTPRGCG
jgi:S1-C subfamily serine protease